MTLECNLPSRELTYPTFGKGKSSSKVPNGRGYVIVPWRVVLVIPPCLFRNRIPSFGTNIHSQEKTFFGPSPPKKKDERSRCSPVTIANSHHFFGHFRKLYCLSSRDLPFGIKFDFVFCFFLFFVVSVELLALTGNLTFLAGQNCTFFAGMLCMHT